MEALDGGASTLLAPLWSAIWRLEEGQCALKNNFETISETMSQMISQYSDVKDWLAQMRRDAKAMNEETLRFVAGTNARIVPDCAQRLAGDFKEIVKAMSAKQDKMNTDTEARLREVFDLKLENINTKMKAMEDQMELRIGNGDRWRQTCMMRLESLEADVAEQLNDMQEKMPDLELRIGNVAEQLNDMQEKMPDLELRIGNVAEQLNDMKEKMPYLERRIGNGDRWSHWCRSALEGLDEKLNAKFSPMEVKMQRCMDHLDELQQILNDSTKIAHAITEVGVQMHDTDALVEEANGEFLFVNR